MTIEPQTEPIIDDVWSRTELKYRTRAVALLLANTVLFGALCCFMYWLRYGWFFPPTHEEYRLNFIETLNFAGQLQITLYDLFMEPISLKMVPMQGVVIGLLIASLVSIPILVAILYRFGASIAFCVMVSFLAVMPWLGATLLLSCAIATYSRRKLKFRFAAALLGLVPIGVYFFTASRGYATPGDVLTPQIERGLAVAPLLLSALACCASMVIVLSIARMVDFRPGAIAPLLAIMFLTPWFLFMNEVGRDELHYRLFEQHYGPRSKQHFAGADANFAVRRVAARLWADGAQPDQTIVGFEHKVRQFFESQLQPIRAAEPDGRSRIYKTVEDESLEHLKLFARSQHRVAVESDNFLRDFPNSRFVPCVLYIKGRALDIRVDTPTFRMNGTLRFYSDFPKEASRATWIALLQSSPESPLARVARYRIAQLDARRGEIDQAITVLTGLLQFDADRNALKASSSRLETLLAKKPAEASLESEYRENEEQAAALLELLRSNREPISGDAALITFLSSDPRHPKYLQNLREILRRFGHCKIRDNLELRLALAEPSTKARIEKLQQLHERYPDGDTRPQTLYELGRALVRDGRKSEAAARFRELARDFPGSRYGRVARHALLMDGTTDSTDTGA